MERIEAKKRKLQDRINSVLKKRRKFTRECFHNISSIRLSGSIDEFIEFYKTKYYVPVKKKYHSFKRTEIIKHEDIRILQRIIFGATFYYLNDNDVCIKMEDLDWETWNKIKPVLLKIKEIFLEFIEKMELEPVVEEFNKLTACQSRQGIECSKVCESCGRLNLIVANFCVECGAKFQ